MKSDAEERAKNATKLFAFPINLDEVRREVKDILSTFGKNLFFGNYTTHDISHIDEMLTTVDWIIPEKTKDIMSPGDWLTLVLSIYFHDMGLVVTEDEFNNRANSKFDLFCKETLFKGDGGDDYHAKVKALDEEKKERFLYQEFVRYHHAARIKAWLTGESHSELGYCKAQVKLIDKLLDPLGDEFRSDLAQVCESHNLSDIEDTKKYRQYHPYGNSTDEEVNLQYIAALLRTIDLIQITKKRAPSALYRLIDPTDPISQLEWAKQNAVISVRAQKQTDDEDNVLDAKQQDTIEVYATFNEEASFFALNAYLRYANEQVKATFEALEKTKGSSPKRYIFPWRKIDDTNVKANGFEKEPFGFEIDQEKILDLLTGHTLYNDSSVVVRELIQNAIDAVRLKYYNDTNGSEKKGEIKVSWNNKSRELAVVDNGTGMSMSTIQNHLLKVGSSKYQSPKFKEEFPRFAPISRFGIGVLTAFMVAEKVEITTVSLDDEKAHKISLRSVHGKYLIKLIDKSEPEIVDDIGTHGSKFVLQFRTSAKRMDIQKTLENYVLFPRCNVTLSIDGSPPAKIGFSSPKDALNDYLAKENTVKRYGEVNTKVVEETDNGITIAYAMSYSSHYKDWQFVRVPERASGRRNKEKSPPIMTCVEGIVVENLLVGGIDQMLLAVINMTGEKAPKTNVARSALETTDEFELAVKAINRMLLGVVEKESTRLVNEEGYSLTWAVDQMPRMMQPIVGDRSTSASKNAIQIKRSELNKIKIFLVEKAGKRYVQSAEDLLENEEFWTVDSILLSSVEELLREAKSKVSRQELLDLVYGGKEKSLNELFVVTNAHTPICKNMVQSLFEISYFRSQTEDRRLDVKWSKKSDRWFSRSEIFNSLMELDGHQDYDLYKYMEGQFQSSFSATRKVFAPRGGDHIDSVGLDSFQGVTSLGNLYLLPDSSIADFFTEAPEEWNNDREFLKTAFFLMFATALAVESSYTEIPEIFARLRKSMPEQLLTKSEDSFQKCQTIWNDLTKFNCYDPFSWRSRSNHWHERFEDSNYSDALFASVLPRE